MKHDVCRLATNCSSRKTSNKAKVAINEFMKEMAKQFISYRDRRILRRAAKILKNSDLHDAYFFDVLCEGSDIPSSEITKIFIGTNFSIAREGEDYDN